MVAIHILQKPVLSARVYLKVVSWGFMFLVFDSSGEPVNRPDEIVCAVPYSSGTEILVGRSASEGEAVGASTGARMEIPSSL